MIFNWSLTSVLFDGHIRNIENLNYSIYWTFTISSALELPSDLLSIVGMEVIGRRWSAVISLGTIHSSEIKRFMLDEMIWRNASKFATYILHRYKKTLCSSVFHFMLCTGMYFIFSLLWKPWYMLTYTRQFITGRNKVAQNEKATCMGFRIY